MRITAVEEYGLRCLLNLARIGAKAQLSISEIAAMEGLSVPYTSKLLSILRKSGLVLAARGRGGGFSIAREPEDITVFDVLTALGGPLIDPGHCKKYTGQLGECVHLHDCSVHEVFGSLAGYVKAFLSGTSLKDLLEKTHGNSSRESLRREVYSATYPIGEANRTGDEKN